MSDGSDQHMLINQDALTYAFTEMIQSGAHSRSLAILGTESHALMHNQAQKQSMTLFGKLASPRSPGSADARSLKHMRYPNGQETPPHMASPPPDRYRGNSSPPRCYRYVGFPRKSISSRPYEEGYEADWKCWGYMYEDQEE